MLLSTMLSSALIETQVCSMLLMKSLPPLKMPCLANLSKMLKVISSTSAARATGVADVSITFSNCCMGSRQILQKSTEIPLIGCAIRSHHLLHLRLQPRGVYPPSTVRDVCMLSDGNAPRSPVFQTSNLSSSSRRQKLAGESRFLLETKPMPPMLSLNVAHCSIGMLPCFLSCAMQAADEQRPTLCVSLILTVYGTLSILSLKAI